MASQTDPSVSAEALVAEALFDTLMQVTLTTKINMVQADVGLIRRDMDYFR